MTKPVEFPKYAELSEEERRRLLDTVGQGILLAQGERLDGLMALGVIHEPAPSDFDADWDTFTYLGPVADGADLEMENQPHVLVTTETRPGEYVHQIVYGRRRFARKH